MCLRWRIQLCRLLFIVAVSVQAMGQAVEEAAIESVLEQVAARPQLIQTIAQAILRPGATTLNGVNLPTPFSRNLLQSPVEVGIILVNALASRSMYPEQAAVQRAINERLHDTHGAAQGNAGIDWRQELQYVQGLNVPVWESVAFTLPAPVPTCRRGDPLAMAVALEQRLTRYTTIIVPDELALFHEWTANVYRILGQGMPATVLEEGCLVTGRIESGGQPLPGAWVNFRLAPPDSPPLDLEEVFTDEIWNLPNIPSQRDRDAGVFAGRSGPMGRFAVWVPRDQLLVMRVEGFFRAARAHQREGLRVEHRPLAVQEGKATAYSFSGATYDFGNITMDRDWAGEVGPLLAVHGFYPGTVDAAEKKLNAELVLRNDGDAPLAISGIEKSCACAALVDPETNLASDSLITLMPGESARRLVTVDLSSSPPGPNKKTFSFHTDELSSPVQSYSLVYDVITGSRIAPSLLRFTFQDSETPTLREQVELEKSVPESDAKITGIRTVSGSSFATVTMSPDSDGLIVSIDQVVVPKGTRRWAQRLEVDIFESGVTYSQPLLIEAVHQSTLRIYPERLELGPASAGTVLSRKFLLKDSNSAHIESVRSLSANLSVLDMRQEAKVIFLTLKTNAESSGANTCIEFVGSGLSMVIPVDWR